MIEVSTPPAPVDARLYIPQPLVWSVHVMRGAEKEYCCDQLPGQDYFHLLVPGEVYVQGGNEKLCLNCALRRGAISTNRLFWQQRDE